MNFENLNKINGLQNLHLCTQKNVCATRLGPFEEVGIKSPLQLLSQTHVAKMNDKKVIAQN